MKSHELIRKLPSYRTYAVSPFSARQLPGYGLAILMSLAAFAARWVLEASLPPGFPFLTFFPVVALAAFVAGIWPGLLAAVIGFLASWYFFVVPANSFALTSGAAVAMGFYVLVVGVNLLLMNMALAAFVTSDRMIQRNRELSEFQSLLIRELDHRIKNLFSVVAAVVKLSAREASTPAELAETATARIMALSRSHSSLWQVGKDNRSTVQGVARQILEPYIATAGDRIDIEGETIIADIRQIQIISLIFHELATNSAKYGSLSTKSGRINISAQQLDDPSGNLVVAWQEDAAADHSTTPEQAGFGTELISRLVSAAGGKFERVFEAGRMRARTELPAT